MREFFRGWRRTVGCVTLVMACVVAGLWCRSLIVEDHLMYVGKSYFSIRSNAGIVSYHHFWSAPGSGLFDGSSAWSIMTDQSHVHAPKSYLGNATKSERWRWGSLEYGRRLDTFPDNPDAKWGDSGAHAAYWFAAYSAVGIPLTLLSAYLLFGKPLQRAVIRKLIPSDGTILIRSSLIGFITLGGFVYILQSCPATIALHVDNPPNIDLKDTSLTFFLDGELISAGDLGKPLQLKDGLHELLVKRDSQLRQRMTLAVSLRGCKVSADVQNFETASQNRELEELVPQPIFPASRHQWTDESRRVEVPKLLTN